MDYVFGFTALVLAAAMVVLFAMLGEVSARLDSTGSGRGQGFIRLLDQVSVGHAPQDWPEPVREMALAERSLALVLSTTCSSCVEVAAQLRAEPKPIPGYDLYIVISTSDPAQGLAFVEHHGIEGVPYFVDELGQWVTREFNLRHSPSALLFHRGRLTSGVLFNDIATLRAAVTTPDKEAKV
jgi:hypothetical protein